MKRIEERTFFGCSSLTSIRIADSITCIAAKAFCKCSSLTNIYIPDGVKSIGEQAFYGCESLTSIRIPDGSWSEWDKIMLDQPGSIRCSVSLKKAAAAVRPKLCVGFAQDESGYSEELRAEYIAYIKRNAVRLTELAFDYPELLRLMCREKLISARNIDKFIEEAAYSEDIELMAVLLDYQANVLTMKAVCKAREQKEKMREKQEDMVIDRMEAREGKIGLEELNFAAAGSLDRFERRSELKSFIEWLGGKLFSSMSAKVDYLITNEEIDGEKQSRAQAWGIDILTEDEFIEKARQSRKAVISEGTRVIPALTFWKCTSLESVVIPNSVREINSSAFTGCSALRKFIIAENHPVYRFENDMLLTKAGAVVCVLASVENASVPEGITSIGRYAFADSDALQTVCMPDSVSLIEEGAFSNCRNLSKISFSASLTEIKPKAFEHCMSLTEIALPGGIASVSQNLFRNCRNLRNISLPDSVTVIEDGAFDGCIALEAAELPGLLRAIGASVFRDCGTLSKISVPDSVEFIGRETFCGCTSLSSVSLSANIREIAELTFSGCESLTEIIIPDDVTRIGWNAFKNCRNLASVFVRDFLLCIDADIFEGCKNARFIRW